MRADKDVLGKQTAAAALGSKIGLIRTRNLTPIFSSTMIDRAKLFSPLKTTFQRKQVE